MDGWINDLNDHLLPFSYIWTDGGGQRMPSAVCSQLLDMICSGLGAILEIRLLLRIVLKQPTV